jgi:hypothetical protein
MHRASLGLAMLAVVAPAGCKHKSQLVVGVITNLKVHNELSDVEMDLSRNGVVFQSLSWPISDQKALDFVLPGSFTLYSESGGAPVIDVVVNGLAGDKIAVVRHATVQLQSEQDLFFRMSLVQKCATGQAISTCPDGMSCIEGICKVDTVDAHTLKAYTAERASTIECDSGTAFFDTSTCSSGACAPLTPTKQREHGKD